MDHPSQPGPLAALLFALGEAQLKELAGSPAEAEFRAVLDRAKAEFARQIMPGVHHLGLPRAGYRATHRADGAFDVCGD